MKWLKRDTFDKLLILFWFVDLIFTTINTIKGYPTMTQAERRLSYIYMFIDLLWLFAISANLTIRKTFDLMKEVIEYGIQRR